MQPNFSVIEDNDLFLVINKANNVDFHTSDGVLGIVEQVKSELGITRLYPVHRLDKMTSGLLVLAKNAQTAADFGRLFECKQIIKYYLALSDKKPKKKQGLISGDMKKGRNGSYLLVNTTDKPAMTQFFSYSLAPSLRGFLLKPHTGKTHQLRVAMKSLGSPIKGDTRYYPNATGEIGYLHAWKLEFCLSGIEYSFCAEPQWAIPEVQAWTNRLNQESITWPTLRKTK